MDIAVLRIRFHGCRHNLPDRSRWLYIIIAKIIDAAVKQAAISMTVLVAPDMR